MINVYEYNVYLLCESHISIAITIKMFRINRKTDTITQNSLITLLHLCSYVYSDLLNFYYILGIDQQRDRQR